MAVTQLGDGNDDGVMLGRAAASLVGFHGATPSDQAGAITLTSGTLGDANTAIQSILVALREKGLIAT